MKNAFVKNNIREVGHTLGRFLAIMLIIALGVGFFAGLKVTRKAMIKTGDEYLRDCGMYDFKLLSSYGFEKGDAERVKSDLDFIEYAEEAYNADAFADIDDGEYIISFISLGEKVNVPHITAGRMPEEADECILDARLGSTDFIGKKILLPDTAQNENRDMFSCSEYTVVGLCNSPLYLNFERGTTKLEGGAVNAFAYLTEEGFDSEYYTSLCVTLSEKAEIFSDDYDDIINKFEDGIKNELETVADERYDRIVADARAEVEKARTEYEENLAALNDEKKKALMRIAALAGVPEMYEKAKAELDSKFAEPDAELEKAKSAIDDAEAKISEIEKPETYVLTRDENVGYVCFENDSMIVEGIARVFPIFFFLVAALVCSTTMTRMIGDHRTQIGTLKALGYGNGRIMSKYLLYSGSAATIGSIFGFAVGTKMFPYAIWKSYDIMYGFAEIKYVFDPVLAALSLAAALVCSVGVTASACRSSLAKMPARLMRPKTPKAGKRILLERIPLIWNHLGFLRKVSIRNIFRYKKRMFMMVLGIGGCMALLLTGLGIKDSISNIASDQYDNILLYDIEAKFDGDFGYEGAVLVRSDTAEVMADGDIITSVLVYAGRDIENVVHFYRGKSDVRVPDDGVLVTEKIASAAGVRVGDRIKFRVRGDETLEYEVRGIFENHVRNYVYVFGEDFVPNTAYIKCAEGEDAHEIAAELMNDGATTVSVIADFRARIENMMESLNYVVWLVIACAGALAFIVLFNLSNINITERVREIATIKVLGFYPSETGAYVFRENLILTFFGVIVGIPLGIALHRFVMSQINIDMVAFDVRITALSYGVATVTTFVFTAVVDLIMRRKLAKIDMAQSLKSVE